VPIRLLTHPLADASWFSDNWGWIVGGFIVVVGLLGFGWRELSRFSIRRAWAISGVCFAESIRKRVLWITPLAILGVIVVTQLERAYDEADAIRQTVKFCLFATGLVVILTSIILACTNLPKEIQTRVIYTIVTKPITRLEIIVGKVMGFARVSLAILLIMGGFTSIYLHLRARGQQAQIENRLHEGDISDSERARLTHYQEYGLLRARSIWAPDSLQMYGRQTDPASNFRIINGEGDQDLLVDFPIDRKALFGEAPSSDSAEDWSRQGIGESGLVIRVNLNYQRTGPATDQPELQSPEIQGPQLAPTTRRTVPPLIGIDMLDEGQFSFISDPMIGGTDFNELVKNIGDYGKAQKVINGESSGVIRLTEQMTQADGTSGHFAYAWLQPEMAAKLLTHSHVYIRIAGESNNTDFQVGGHPVQMFVPRLENGRLLVESPGAPEVQLPMNLIFRGRLGLKLEQQLRGGPANPSVAVFSFRNTPPASSPDEQIPFEISSQIERENSDAQEGREDATILDVQLVNLNTKQSTPAFVNLESRRPGFFTVPAQALAGGNYDLVVRCRNPGHIAGFFPASLQMIMGSESFEWNLLKSLSILWMMSILVIALAVTCSTFLSWPIAVVLTIVLLLGRWGVTHLADAAGADLGHQIVADFKIGETNAPVAKVVSSSVEALNNAMQYFARILPDPGAFDAIDSTEQGLSLPREKLGDAFTMMGGFGLPAIVIGYLILKNKEVAP
jgi:hypothetical protein